MTLDFSAPSYYTSTYWYHRREDATSIAARFERYLDRLAEISPLLTDMYIRVKTMGVPYETARPNLASLVHKCANRDDKRRIDTAGGFSIDSLTRRKNNNFSAGGEVGRDYGYYDLNNFKFSTMSGFWPDLSTMTYPFFRDTALAAIACWEPLFCSVQPDTLCPYMVRGWYHETWMTYVHPSLVHRVAPLDIPVVEATPDGGLLLAATTETFDAANPGHLEAARAIRRATHHLDDIMPPLR